MLRKLGIALCVFWLVKPVNTRLYAIGFAWLAICMMVFFGML